MQNNTFYQAIDPSVSPLLEKLEELHLVERVEKAEKTEPIKLSDKYIGVFSEEDAASFDSHVKAIREE